MGLKKLIKDCLTENDGQSYCPFRVAGALLTSTSIPTFIGSTLYTVFLNHHFDYIAFGTAFGAMASGLSVLAAGVGFKAKTDTPL